MKEERLLSEEEEEENKGRNSRSRNTKPVVTRKRASLLKDP